MWLRLPFVLAVILPLLVLRSPWPGSVQLFVIALVAFGGARLAEMALRRRAKDHDDGDSLLWTGMLGAAAIALFASLGVRWFVIERARPEPSRREALRAAFEEGERAPANEVIPGSFRAVAVGESESIALPASGAVCTWNPRPSTSEEGPRICQPVAGTEGAEQVTTLHGHACALRRGQGLCWGWNYHGEIGRPSTGSDDHAAGAVPVAMPDGVLLAAISAGTGHSCGVDRGGIVWCWGDNDVGQSGGTSPEHGPERVALPVAATAVEAGFRASCALGADRRVYCWGDRELVGNGVTPSVFGPEPQVVAGLSAIRRIDLGERSACALDQSGAMWCWGREIHATEPTVPRRQPIDGVVDIAVGHSHRCAVRRDRTVQCWGENWYGQLGDGRKVKSNRPVDVRGVSKATSVSAGTAETCAIEEGGRLVCWGRFAVSGD